MIFIDSFEFLTVDEYSIFVTLLSDSETGVHLTSAYFQILFSYRFPFSNCLTLNLMLIWLFLECLIISSETAFLHSQRSSNAKETFLVFLRVFGHFQLLNLSNVKIMTNCNKDTLNKSLFFIIFFNWQLSEKIWSEDYSWESARLIVATKRIQLKKVAHNFSIKLLANIFGDGIEICSVQFSWNCWIDWYISQPIGGAVTRV